jgi:hypothetical protein
VLLGSFIDNSLVTSKGGKDAAVEAFGALADTICRYPALAEHAKFILIPGLIMCICLFVLFVFVILYYYNYGYWRLLYFIDYYLFCACLNIFNFQF